jgi:RimJ/RimL family protein N-acetyltransferase
MTHADLDDLAALFADEEIMRHYPSTKTREEAFEWIRWNESSYRGHGFGLWTVISRRTAEFLGDCGLVLQSVDGSREVEIGYHIKRSHWRRGIATEAAAACRDYAFELLGLDRLISIIGRANVRSQGVAKRVGMELEKEAIWQGRPQLIYSVTRSHVS